MSNKTSHLLSTWVNEQEGSPDEREQQEVVHPLKTATVPAIQDAMDIQTNDTGVLAVVKHGIEGRDNDDEQDASLTKNETKLRTQRETDSVMNKTTAPVLIVEDTVELGEVIQATLEGMGLQAVHETHGTTGLDKMKEIHPDLVIMDIGLPDITGWKMLDFIKEYYTDAEDDMPTIIVITAYGDPANRLIGKLQNIHSYLIKPFTPDQVEHVVGMALRGEKPDDPTNVRGPSSTV
jgi:CheY-like chemotaxis protein